MGKWWGVVVCGLAAVACYPPGYNPGRQSDWAEGAEGAAGPVQPPVPTWSAERDEFNGIAHARFAATPVFDSGYPPGEPGFSILLFYETDAPRGFISINSVNPRWRWLECHHVDLLIDGEPAAISPCEHDGGIGSTRGGVYIMEHVRVRFEADTAYRLAQARTVRGRVCSEVFDLPPAAVEGLRGIAQYLPPVPGVDAPASGEGAPAPAPPSGAGLESPPATE